MYIYLTAHSKLEGPSRGSQLPYTPVMPCMGPGTQVNDRTNEGNRASGREGSSSRQVTMFCFSFLNPCYLSNYNEPHCVGFKQNVFVLLLRKQKNGRNEAFRTDGQTLKYQKHTEFTGLPCSWDGGSEMRVEYLVSCSLQVCLI